MYERNKKKERTYSLVDRMRECELNGKTELDISHMSIADLPFEIQILQDLRIIDACKNMLISVPSLSTFKSLVRLDISRNCIVSLDDVKWSHFPLLAHLDVSRNQLSHLPEDISKLVSLNYLICNRNNLVCVYVKYELFIRLNFLILLSL